MSSVGAACYASAKSLRGTALQVDTLSLHEHLAVRGSSYYVTRCFRPTLTYTPVGRHIYAIGDNPEAARLTGIPTQRIVIGVYAVAGFFYGVAGLLLVGRTGVGDPQAGQDANLESITAVVIGGTSLFGGRGTVIGTLIGALIVGVLRNGLQLMGVQSIYQVLFTGLLVIIAVSIDQLSRRGRS